MGHNSQAIKKHITPNVERAQKRKRGIRELRDLAERNKAYGLKISVFELRRRQVKEAEKIRKAVIIKR